MGGASKAGKVPSVNAKRFLTHLFWLVLLCVGVGLWTSAYTEWSAGIGAFLAFGGSFAPLALIEKQIPEEVSKELKSRFVRALQHRLAGRVLLIITLFLGGATCFVGTVRVQAGENTVNVSVVRKLPGTPDPVAANTRMNFPRLTVPFAPSTWKVKAKGVPYQSVEIGSWDRPLLRIPDSFSRRVLLVVPAADLLNRRGNDSTDLLDISIAGERRLLIPNYTWAAFWIGCDGEVALPESLQTQLNALATDEFLKSRMLHPQSLPSWIAVGAKDQWNLEFDLAEGAEVKIEAVRYGVKILSQLIRVKKGSGTQLEFLDDSIR